MTNTKSEILVQFHEWPTHYCLGPLRTLFWTSLQASVLKTSFAGPEFMCSHRIIQMDLYKPACTFSNCLLNSSTA